MGRIPASKRCRATNTEAEFCGSEKGLNSCVNPHLAKLYAMTGSFTKFPNHGRTNSAVVTLFSANFHMILGQTWKQSDGSVSASIEIIWDRRPSALLIMLE
jgi:hypothetical protein